MTAAYETNIDGRVLRTAISTADGICLSYILTEENISDELGDRRRSYSFFVALCDEHGGTDSEYVRDVTSRRDLAFEFFSMISDGAVTPCALRTVAEDLVASI